MTDVNRGRNTKSKELMLKHLICYNSRRKEKSRFLKSCCPPASWLRWETRFWIRLLSPHPVFLEIMELVLVNGTFSGTKGPMPQKIVFMVLLT